MSVVSNVGLPQGLQRVPHESIKKPYVFSLPKQRVLLALLRKTISSLFSKAQNINDQDLFFGPEILGDLEEAFEEGSEEFACALASLSQSFGDTVALFQDRDGDLFLTSDSTQIDSLRANNLFTELSKRPDKQEISAPPAETRAVSSARAARIRAERGPVPLFESVRRFGKTFKGVLGLCGCGGTAMWAALGQYLGVSGNSDYADLRIYVDREAAVLMQSLVRLRIDYVGPGESFEDYFGDPMFKLLNEGTIKVLQGGLDKKEIFLVVKLSRLRHRVVSGQLVQIAEPAAPAFVPSEAPTREHDVRPLSPEEVGTFLYVHLATNGLLYPGQGDESLGAVNFVPGEQINYFPALLGLMSCFNNKVFPKRGMRKTNLFLSLKAKEMFLRHMRKSIDFDKLSEAQTPLTVRGVLDLYNPILGGGTLALFRSKADPNLVLCVLSDEVDSFPETAAFDRILFEPTTFEMDVLSCEKASPRPRKKEPLPFFVRSGEPDFTPHKEGPMPAGGLSPYMMIRVDGEERAMFIAGLEKIGYFVGNDTKFYCDSSMAIILEIILTRFRRGLSINVSSEKQAAMMARELRDAASRCHILQADSAAGEEVFFSSMTLFDSATPPA